MRRSARSSGRTPASSDERHGSPMLSSTPMDERTPEQLKHLDFAQSNIARMHNASMSMKRYALAAFALGASLARFLNDPTILGITFLVVVSFYVLDAKYLQSERAFRVIYDGVRMQAPGSTASFELKPNIGSLVPLSELTSWSTCLLYCPILALFALLWIGTDWLQLPSVGTQNG